jgi:hypothetical protein
MLSYSRIQAIGFRGLVARQFPGPQTQLIERLTYSDDHVRATFSLMPSLRCRVSRLKFVQGRADHLLTGLYQASKSGHKELDQGII